MPRPNGYLLDTNITIALVRGNVLGRYLDRTYRLTTPGLPFFMPVIAVGEAGSLARKWGWGSARLSRLANSLALFPRLDISDDAILNAYADIDAGSASIGIDMGKNDVWIASIARVFDLTVLTTDNDFDHLFQAGLVDVEWVDPTSK